MVGHPADQVLHVLKKDLNISDNNSVPMCEVCQRAKQTREPFPLSDHKSKTLGELVHLDLCGSYRVHNREVETVRSDNGTEFVNKRMFDMFSDLDVETTSDVDHLQFFDSLFPQSPNDDGKDSSVEEGSLPHSDGHSTQGKTQSDGLTATQIDDQNWSEGNSQNFIPNISQSSLTQNNDEVQTPVLRRSERQTKVPIRLNDYVLNSNVKYGIEKYLNYSNLNTANL
ncbi:hypothetical protein Tco_0140213 [Tanacetum coccineum]